MAVKLANIKKRKKRKTVFSNRKGLSVVKHRYQASERRQHVITYKIKGWTKQQIADELGVSVSTIKNDLRIMRKQNAELFSDSNKYDFISDSLSVYEAIQRSAWEDYQSTKEDVDFKSLAPRYLEIIRSAEGDKIKALRELGIFADQSKEENERTKELLKQQMAMFESLAPELKEQVAAAMIQSFTPTPLKPPKRLKKKINSPHLVDDDDDEDDFDDED